VTPDVLPLDAAREYLRADRGRLLAEAERISVERLADPHHRADGPLGDFCESLHDLVAHVLMWDEINLAVLAEAAAGRTHWSLEPTWETTEAGRYLNRGGVAAGRAIPSALLLVRYRRVRDALTDQCGQYDDSAWAAPAAPPGGPDLGPLGALAQRIWTVPGQASFRHASIHLDGPTLPR
jgi:hypothetical protein